MADDPRNHLLNRNVRLYLGTAGLLSGSLFGSYAVLMNLFILRLDFGTEFVGLVNGIGLICWAIAAPIAGAWANRFGYRRLMLFGLGGVVLGSNLLPFGAVFSGGTRAAWLVVSYAIATSGAGVFFVNMHPFLMGVVIPKLRSRVFALSSATFPTAGFIGSLIGGFLPALLAGPLGVTLDDPVAFRYPLHLAALAVIPTLLLIAATREIEPFRREATPGVRSRAPLFAITAMTILGILRPFGEGTARTFFNVYMDAGLNVDIATIGIAFAFAQLLAAPLALASPFVSSRIGTGRTIFFSVVGVTICLVPMALFANPIAATLGLISVLAFVSVMRPALALYNMELVRPEFWAFMSGFVNLSWALGSGGTALVGGVLISSFGYQSLFLTGAAVSATSALLYGLFLIVHRPSPPEDENHEGTIVGTVAPSTTPPGGPVS